MPRCGCGDQCNCLVVEGIGTDVPGTGNVGNAYVINVDGSEIVGDGMAWQGNKFVTRLATGGGLEFDASGAMRTTGGHQPGEGRADVSQLEQRAQDVLIGSIGAGFYIKPTDQLRSFQYGLQQGLDAMHVPVRMLMDGSPVVRFSEKMERSSRASTEDVQNQDAHIWSVTTSHPGYDYFHRLAGDFALPATPPIEAGSVGWWGYLEHGELGLTFLSDVLREVGGKIVLILELLWPARDGSGNMPTAPGWRVDMFLAQVKNMILNFGLTNSVVVTSSEIEVPTNTLPGPNQKVLDSFVTAGIRVGPYIVSEAAFDKIDPTGPNWDNRWTWAFASRSIPRPKLAKLIAKPVHTILFLVSRQYLRDTLVNLPGGIGAKGVISADPEYYGGPFLNQRHRADSSGSYWRSPTVKPGLLPAGPEALDRMAALQRGYGKLSYHSYWLGAGTPKDARSTSAYVLQGYMCPHPGPTSQGMDIGFGFDQIPPNYGWMAVAFGVRTDHGFADRQLGLPTDPSWDLDSGYVLLFDTAGGVFLYGYDKGAGSQLGNQSAGVIPYGPPKPIGHPQNPDRRRGEPQWIRIGLNANGIKVSKITGPGDPNTGAMILQDRTDLAKAHRGPFWYYGRFSATAGAQWEGFFDHPVLLYNADPPIGPPAT